MASQDGIPKAEKGLEGARLGLSLLRSLQEQGVNRRPNVNHGFSVSSPFFSMSAQPRPEKTDALEDTITQLQDVQKLREDRRKIDQDLGDALNKTGLIGQVIDQGGQVQLPTQGGGEVKFGGDQGGGLERALNIMSGINNQSAQGQANQQAQTVTQQRRLEPSVSVDESGRVKVNIKSIETEESKATRQVETQARKTSLERLNKIDNLVPLIEQLEQQLESVPVGTGVKGKLRGLGEAAQGAIGADPFSATSIAQLEGFTAQIARTLGEVGNLAEGEQKRAQSLVPKATDNEETRGLKGLATLTFAKKIFKREAGKSKLADREDMVGRLDSLDEAIRNRVKSTIETFQQMEPKKSSEFVKRLQQFMGDDINEIGLPSFSSVDDLKKNLDSLEAGDVVLVGNRVVLVN